TARGENAREVLAREALRDDDEPIGVLLDAVEPDHAGGLDSHDELVFVLESGNIRRPRVVGAQDLQSHRRPAVLEVAAIDRRFRGLVETFFDLMTEDTYHGAPPSYGPSSIRNQEPFSKGSALEL